MSKGERQHKPVKDMEGEMSLNQLQLKAATRASVKNPLTKLEALDILKQWRRYKVANVYDVVGYALNVAMPDWEWPDWDWRTVGEFIKEAEKEFRP